MAKEWILNNVMNRFQLNFKRNVGATSKSIRECKPKNKDDWEKYYYDNVRSKEHIKELGKKLFEKIKGVIKEEIESISVEDCISYMENLLINRTFEGYMNEVFIIKDLLEKKINMDIKEAPDEWDRLFAVDFFIKVKDKYIGLQIKPQDIGTTLQVFAKERTLLKGQHEKFTKKYGGDVFMIYSIKEDNKKVIQNYKVIDDIKKEIKRLS